MNDIQRYLRAKELAELISSGKVVQIPLGNKIVSSRIQRCRICSEQQQKKEGCLGYFIETQSGEFPQSGHCLILNNFKRKDT